ncbi:hypothetical protein Hypma_012799 [Hypsizygus marmoreus]|uniref:Pentatricopeptide repeat-containing protein 5, mitochondrial n=1 Tax=Hypsizygus marmoreus TaxID=39966 RepID=A0A369JCL7_HYPMA|nr:hypothetical protein Hypma_012799 [Hypsizygus marmoreus]
MVEPFAAVIFNTLVSGRSTLRHPPSLNSVARVMATSSRKSVVSDFFTPQPRRVKGKEKAEDTSDLSCFLSQCQEWSSCAHRHSLWCSDRSRFMMMEELTPTPSRSPRRYRSRQIPNAKSSLTHTVYGGQRRHASNASELTIQTQYPPSLADLAASAAPSDKQREDLAIRRLRTITRIPADTVDLNKAWETYLSVSHCNIDLQLLMQFTDKLLNATELHYHRDKDLDILHLWGLRTQGILNAVTPRITALAPFDQWRLCMLSRSMSLLGDLKQATEIAHDANAIPATYENKGGIISAFNCILLSTSVHRNNVEAVKFIASQWEIVGSHLTQRTSEWHYGGPARWGNYMRRNAFLIIAEIDYVASLLNLSIWDKDRRETMGNFMIEALCDFKLPLAALEVFREMQKQRLFTSTDAQIALIRKLASENVFEPAMTMFHSLSATGTRRSIYSTGVYLYGRQGNGEEAERYFRVLERNSWVSDDDTAMLLYAYSTQGLVNEATALFDNFFPEGPDGARLNSPKLRHFTAVIYGHSRRGDSKGITRWLEIMSKSGLDPDIYVFTVILNNLAIRGDMDGVLAILKQMRAARVQPNVVTYTIVIALFAHHKDAVGAEAMFKRAIQEGVVPDRRMITSLMNAHVEAGSWEGVIRAYDYIHAFPSHHIRPTIEVYNTLIKAYVMMAAPFPIVSKIFNQLEASRVKPDDRTFSLVIQSACDAGRMDIAADMFYQMDKIAAQDSERGLEINVYVLTILMAGFLRVGDKIKAKAVYDEMRDRGIQPTAITFNTILKAYGNERSEESMKVAEEFINTLMGTPAEERVWDTPSYGRKTALQHIYGPVIAAYAKQEKVEDAERMFQEMIAAGQPPTLGTLTAVLDAYRRTFNTEAALRIWPEIFQLGLRYSKDRFLIDGDDSDPTRARLQGNILTVPLSIYIDVLSSAGLHQQIAAVWKEFQALGFTFDSHNWNHLAVALVRAGQPERAFEVVEKVLLHRPQLDIKEERDKRPSTPLLYESASTDVRSTFTKEPPKHSDIRRATVAKLTASKAFRTDIEGENAEYALDMAHPLHILHQVTPIWAFWRPHVAVLSVFLVALSRLESGTLVKPVGQDEDETTPADDEPSQAREILNRIYQNYPNTVQAVLDHETRERRRLGDDYDRNYNWR